MQTFFLVVAWVLSAIPAAMIVFASLWVSGAVLTRESQGSDGLGEE